MKQLVTVTELKLTPSKNDLPMVSITFTPVQEETPIIFNQIITHSFQLSIVNELLKMFDTDCDIKFESYRQYNELLENIYDSVKGITYNLITENSTYYVNAA